MPPRPPQPRPKRGSCSFLFIARRRSHNSPSSPPFPPTFFIFSGGKLVAKYIGKKAKGPVCGDTGAKLNGIPALRPKEYRSVAKRVKSVSRCYGGTLSGGAVKARIVRAFLIEEQKIVKKVIQEKNKAKKKKKKKSKK